MKKLIFAALALFVLSSFQQERRTTIFMIGDSTMADKDISKGSPERGWGMVLKCYFDDNIRIDNHARNGRSSKSFIDEGLWEKVRRQIHPGDYVIIQFGHNDEKPQPQRHTDPGSTFDYNLRRFIRETREQGGIPILMNAVVRRNFQKVAVKNDDDEALRNTTYQQQAPEEGDSLVETHGMYVVAPRDIAREMNVAFVDADSITFNLEQRLGAESTKQLHMWLKPGEIASIPAGRQDNTHYNVKGAHTVARLLRDAIVAEVPILQKYTLNYDIAVSSEGRGDYMSLDEAIRAVPAGQSATIQILDGTWDKPVLPRKSKIQFILRRNANWK
ncbi:MAG: pectin esterase [Prevotella sp.]|nr:pectin esterase [Prevotella sp.]